MSTPYFSKACRISDSEEYPTASSSTVSNLITTAGLLETSSMLYRSQGGGKLASLQAVCEVHVGVLVSYIVRRGKMVLTTELVARMRQKVVG